MGLRFLCRPIPPLRPEKGTLKRTRCVQNQKGELYRSADGSLCTPTVAVLPADYQPNPTLRKRRKKNPSAEAYKGSHRTDTIRIFEPKAELLYPAGANMIAHLSTAVSISQPAPTPNKTVQRRARPPLRSEPGQRCEPEDCHHLRQDQQHCPQMPTRSNRHEPVAVYKPTELPNAPGKYPRYCGHWSQ